ncbi:hypothetical protein [Paenibacillus naphthalenovorans]|nr:hypothetical protein [Paenibacillus naphthalenovorans]
MNKKLKHMEEFFLTDNTYTKDARKHGQQIKVARILTDRLITDDYFSDNLLNKKNVGKCIKHQDYLKQQDLDYLCELMKKKLFTWWD